MRIESPVAALGSQAKVRRDLILDAIRGLCLALMTVNHLPGNWLQQYTFHAFGIIGDREIFVFLSGFVAAWLYGRAWERNGAGAFLACVFKGIGRIYLVSMALTFTLMLATELGGSRLADWRELVFYPGLSWQENLLSVVTFRHTIVFITMLRFYAVLLCVFPLIMYGLRRRQEALVLAIAGAIWLAIQCIIAPHLAGVSKGMLPLVRIVAWQPIYALGAMAGYRRAIGAPSLVPKWRWMIWASGGIAGIFFWVRHPLMDLAAVSRLASAHSWIMEDRTLGPLRLLNFLGVVTVAAYLLRRHAAAIVNLPPCRWLAYLGRHSIYVFAASMVTSYFGFLFRHGWAAAQNKSQPAFILACLLSLWLAAAGHERVSQIRKARRRPARAALPRSPHAMPSPRQAVLS